MALSWSRKSVLLAAFLVPAIVVVCSASEWGKHAILHPARRSPPSAPPVPHESVSIRGEGIELEGWRFPAEKPRRGLVVYLHGSSDDRRGGAGIARRFTPLGFEVLAHDLRAHGQSGGEACTYGVLESRDLARVLDGEAPGPVVLIGFSLGASIALQAAALDPRVSLVVAVSAFSDLRTIVHERAPFFISGRHVDEALRRAGVEAGFSVDEAAPLAAAGRVRCPVLLVHGLGDTATPPAHSHRIHAALMCEKELILLPGAGHDDPLDEALWRRIEEAVDRAAPAQDWKPR